MTSLRSLLAGARCAVSALALHALVGAAAPALAEPLRVGGTGSGIGTLQLLAQEMHRSDPAFQVTVVPNLGSSGGIKALASGALHVAVISRPLKPEEAALGLRAIEYGRTAFVLATSHRTVRNLSLSEVADLYAGRRAQWPDGSPVRLVLRPASDFDSSLLAGFSPEIKAALGTAQAREGMVTGMTDQDAVDAIERLPGALGTASMALLLSERRRAQPVAIDGVEPTRANLVSGRYPHSKTMYLVLRNGADPAVERFVRFVASDAGARILAETGHVPPGLASAATVRAAAGRSGSP